MCYSSHLHTNILDAVQQEGDHGSDGWREPLESEVQRKGQKRSVCQEKPTHALQF